MRTGSSITVGLVALVISCCGAYAQGAVPADPGATERNPVPGAEPDASKQSPVHGAIGGVVGGIDGAKNGLIDLDKGVRFREFVLSTHPKSVPYDEPVRVGAVLPEKGLEFYNVPPEYGETPYRYTVIGGDPVLVDPNTRVIKQVIK